VVTHILLVLGALVVGLGLAFAVGRLVRTVGSAAIVALLGLLCAVSYAIGYFGTVAEVPVTRRLQPAAAGKPNIILIVVDTLRADSVEPFGPTPGTTPAFARFAADGVAFTRAYAQSSWTRPSIASILTAQYPSAHGAVHKMDFLPDRAHTMAEALRPAGYWTAAFVNNINVAPVFNFQQGFDEFVYLEPSFYFGATESATKLAIYKGLRVARERLFAHRMYFYNYYQDAEVVNTRVKAWLAEKPPEPFFLLMHYMEPHDPYFEHPYNGKGVARVLTPNPAPERADELRGLYAGAVRYLDEHLGGLFDHLRQSGVYDRSTIVMTADHGEEFQDHGGWWHGTTLYEEGIHVPLVIKRPSEPLRGQRRNDAVRSVDIAPTLMAASGLPAPPSFMGRDLFTGTVTGPLVAEEDLEGNQLASIYVDGWKLITANAGNPRGLATEELYNLDADPKERRNLAGEAKEKVAQLRGELQRMLAEIALPGPRLGVLDNGSHDHAADPRS
jgi:arylsulfatase A-like enzyme